MRPRLIWGDRDAIGPIMIGAAASAYIFIGIWASCTPHDQVTAAHAVSVATYAAELAACRAAAKADSGTLREYQVCACAVDHRYGVDAGEGCQ